MHFRDILASTLLHRFLDTGTVQLHSERHKVRAFLDGSIKIEIKIKN